MCMRAFELLILREAADFLGSLPPSVMDKVYYNIHRIASGERNAELFKEDKRQ